MDDDEYIPEYNSSFTEYFDELKYTLLTEEDIDYLSGICDINPPGFLLYLDMALKNLTMVDLLAADKREPKQVQAELDCAAKSLNKLSSYATNHVYRVLSHGSPVKGAWALPLLENALAVPYDPATINTHPERDELFLHTCHIDKHFIDAKDMKRDETRAILTDVVQFLIDNSGIKASAVSVVNDARS